MEEVRMYFIGLDDGANVGPFLTEEDALKHFAHALSIYSTDDLQPTAIGLHVLHDSLNEDGRVQWIEIARALVKHADCFIWKMEYVSGLTTMINGVSPREIALNILGEGS